MISFNVCLHPKQISLLVAARVAKAQGWEIITLNTEKRIIQAVATTKLLRFKDDVIIKVDQVEDKAIVQMRSKSRLGRGDLGANATRILNYFNALRNTPFSRK